jgi:hypothetical protein
VLGSFNLGRLAGGRPVRVRLTAPIRGAVVFDNVIEASCNPLPEIVAATRQTRKIGRRRGTLL